MKKIVAVFGILAGLINAAIAMLLTTLAGDDMIHANSEWVGYLVMIIALSMIFVGVKQYRDKHLGGVIKFGKAFLVGLYIALVASALYVGSWEVYLQTSDVDFIETYSTSIIENMKAEGEPEAEIQAMQEQLQFYADIYENTFFRILMTLSEILPVGLIIALISAALLRKSSFMPDEENINTQATAT
ncbi:DUF4199 domain-containing protein [Gracilimonas sp.]|uniref:DUF4199 domain-containing protein n=1 Tax=Gracilimonas sp. TaxID=1974203 RepID=UPI0032EC5077